MSYSNRIYTRFCISQRNDAGCINNKRGMARRAKRNSQKRFRQLLKKLDND
jgi:hypothetical protein